MSHILLFLKGMLFGIANLIPGVSGGTIAVVTGIYEKLLDSINNLFKKFKSSILFLLVFGLGALVAILGASKGIDWLLTNLELPTTLLFMGLILGGMKTIKEPVKGKLKFVHYLIMLITLALVIGLLFIPFPDASKGDLKTYEYFILVLCGFLASVAMVVPGISGMMMFYLFGYYDVLMAAFSGLTSSATIVSSLLVLGSVLIGIVIGIFTASKVISVCLKKFKIGTYAAIIGFVIGSIFALIYEGGLLDEIMSLLYTNNLGDYLTAKTLKIYNDVYFAKYMVYIIGLLMFVLGFLGANLLESASKKNETKEKSEANSLEEKEKTREEMKSEMLKELGINEENKIE